MNGASSPSRQVLVTGATGLVGQALVRHLAVQGCGVIALSRDALGARHRFDRREVQCIDALQDVPDDARIEAVVHLAGARVLDQRWTLSRRKQLVDSRLEIASDIRRLAERLHCRPRVLVSASALSVYGATGQELRTESDPPGLSGFGAQLCVRIERDAALARALGLRVVPLRLGIVLAREGGALPPLASSARFGLAAKLGSGLQPVGWIHLGDVVRLIVWLIQSSTIDGPVNAVAPDIPTQAEFARALAAHFKRPAFLRVPQTVLRLLLGERASLLLDGQRAIPAAALHAGFTFDHPTLSDALEDIWPRQVSAA